MPTEFAKVKSMLSLGCISIAGNQNLSIQLSQPGVHLAVWVDANGDGELENADPELRLNFPLSGSGVNIGFQDLIAGKNRCGWLKDEFVLPKTAEIILHIALPL